MNGHPAGPPVLLADGGARQGDADLWCSYAAIRTLSWLGAKPQRPAEVTGFLRARQNADGAFAWQRGLPSDVWATYYCTQALADLGQPAPDADLLAAWIGRLRTSGGGFSMTPGQNADIWATYYAARIHAEILRVPVPAADRLGQWLASTQTESGGLRWAPGAGAADVRACCYGALAWRAAEGRDGNRTSVPWRQGALIAWLQDQQDTDGGFRFAPGYEPCAWATFRAVRALDALASGPRDPEAARRWLKARRVPSGGFERWDGYGIADVWACFSAIGALTTLGEVPSGEERADVAAFVESCRLPGSGFTYTDPKAAGDSLATAAALVLEALHPTDDPTDREALAAWLRRAHLPYEGGVMYMPGRGAEVRCTLWAVEALSTVGAGLDGARIARWLCELQNPDGGFGYWLGRGSDLVSTASAVETAACCGLDPDACMDTAGALRFIEACRAGNRQRPAPGAEPTLAATAQAARALALLGQPAQAGELCVPLADRASRLGGFGAADRALPDLLTTYQVVLAQQVLGLPVDLGGLRRFLAKVRVGSGFSWSPLSRQPAGPLAACLGAQLVRFAASDATPPQLLRLNL